MNKKVIIGIVIVVLCIVIAAAVYFTNSNPQENQNQIANSNEQNIAGTTNESQVAEETNTAGGKNTETETGGKTLVVYYSAQNHTEAVAQQIAQNLGADIFELVPVDEYTSSDLNWNDQNSRVTRIIPIPGSTKLNRLKENLQASEIVLTKEEMEKLNEALSKLDIDETHF